MPQFDFYVWFSLSLSTIATFQILYYTSLYYILAPFSNAQKLLIKLYILYFQKVVAQKSLFEYSLFLYFQNLKLKKINNLVPAASSAKKIIKLKAVAVAKKKSSTKPLLKRNLDLKVKKKIILLKKIGAKLKFNTVTSFILATKRLKKKKKASKKIIAKKALKKKKKKSVLKLKKVCSASVNLN